MRVLLFLFFVFLTLKSTAQSYTYLGRAALTTPQDMVFDPSRNLLYVTNAGSSLQIYNVPQMTLQRTIIVGTALRCVDISPDFSKLAITDASATRVAVMDLNTDAISYYPYTNGFSETGANDVAFADNNTLLFSGFNQWQSIQRINLTTGVTTVIAGSVYSPASLSPSNDRSTIVFSENGISSGPFATIATSNYSIHEGGTSTYNTYAATSPNGSLVAVIEGSRVGIYQKSGNNYQRNGVVGSPTSGSIGVAFSPLHPVVFVTHNNTVSNTIPAIRAYRTDNLTVAGVVESATNLFTSASYSASGPARDGYMHASYDGRYLFAIVAGTIRAYDISLNLRSITSSVSPANSGSIAGAVNVAALNTNLSFTASPTLGFMFDRWTGSFPSTSAVLNFSVTNTNNVVANFVPDTRDPDLDGLDTYHEVTVSKTDPNKADTDEDASPDGVDLFPLDSSEWKDSDGDAIGDNADPDDDNDGYLDFEDTNPLLFNEVIGDFFALIEKDPVLTKQHGGTVSISILRGGAATGTVRTADATHRFKTKGTSIGNGWSYAVSLPRKNGGVLELELTVTTAVEGVLRSQIYETKVSGWKRRYGQNERAVGQLGGMYNAHLKSISTDAIYDPKGWGTSQIRFNSNGMASAMTTMPDGSRFTHSSAVGASGEVGFWMQQRMTNSVSGVLSLDPALFPNQSLIANQAHWRRDPAFAAREPFYSRGVGVISNTPNMDITCSRYEVGDLRTPIAGYPFGFGNASLTIEESLMSYAIFSPNGLFEMGAGSKVFIDPPGTANNLARVDIKLNRQTGAFQGSFVYSLPNSNNEYPISRRLTFSGLFQSSTGIGGGSVIVPAYGLGHTTPTVFSGKVLIERAFEGASLPE